MKYIDSPRIMPFILPRLWVWLWISDFLWQMSDLLRWIFTFEKSRQELMKMSMLKIVSYSFILYYNYYYCLYWFMGKRIFYFRKKRHKYHIISSLIFYLNLLDFPIEKFQVLFWDKAKNMPEIHDFRTLKWSILNLKWGFLGMYWFKLDETWYLGLFEPISSECTKKSEKRVNFHLDHPPMSCHL